MDNIDSGSLSCGTPMCYSTSKDGLMMAFPIDFVHEPAMARNLQYWTPSALSLIHVLYSSASVSPNVPEIARLRLMALPSTCNFRFEGGNRQLKVSAGDCRPQIENGPVGC